MKKLFIKNKKSGFTIIEVMVSITLFLVVVMMGIGSLLNASLVHNKSQNLRSIMDNLNFIMEDMSRNIRTGYVYKCFQKNVDTTLSTATITASPTTRSCTDGWAIAFEQTYGDTTTVGDQWVYYFDNSSGIGKIWRSTQGAAASSFVQLTPDEVNIDSISGFSVLGAEPPLPGGTGDHQQPLVNIRLVGHINYQSISTPFSIQTSVAQRIIDL